MNILSTEVGEGLKSIKTTVFEKMVEEKIKTTFDVPADYRWDLPPIIQIFAADHWNPPS